MDWQHALVLFGSAALAGAVNSVAGGGTLLTFPALLWTGQLATVANATSTVALWPGQLSSLWGYRKELGENRDAIARLAIPSLLGGIDDHPGNPRLQVVSTTGGLSMPSYDSTSGLNRVYVGTADGRLCAYPP